MVKLYISRYINLDVLGVLVTLGSRTKKNLCLMDQENTNLVPDMTDIDEVRKAIIANEILNRKY